MNTTALYIGYAVLAVVGLALAGIAVLMTYATIIGLYRITCDKKTIRFLTRAEAKNINKTSRCAYRYLIEHGCSDSDTLKEVKNKIERHKARHNL